MAGVLTGASHKRGRSNSYSLRRRSFVFRRRYCLVLFLLVFLIREFTKRFSPLAESTVSVQQKAYNLAPKRRPTCPWSAWHTLRYSPLSHTTRRINTYLAMNLYNNEDVLPTFFQELPIVINHLGSRNIFVSIYENNSEDKTQELLGLLGQLLDTLGTPHDINSKGSSVKSHKGNGHRINFLAEARNTAMHPFYSGTAAQRMPGGKFDEVLFINDVYHCASDILEVMLQKRTQGANQACATDWGGRVVYDRWVTRAMSGRTFYNWEEMVAWFNGPEPPQGQSKKVPQLLPHDPVDRVRFEGGLPLQVFSCWNGVTVFDAAAFLPPHNIRFRIAANDLDETGVPKTVTEKASECFLTSVDLWKAGMGKILIVPKASVVYNFEDYDFYRKDGLTRGSRTLSEEKVKWVSKPPDQIAFQDRAVWYKPERWGKWYGV